MTPVAAENVVDENAALLKPIFLSRNSIFFLLPLAKKDLRQMLKDTASVEVMKSLQKQMLLLVEGLATLHSVDIAHRDLDSRNVLVFDGPAGGVILKIADFGHAISLDALNEGFEQPVGMRNFISNGTYSAPECMRVYTGAYNRHDITAIDVWALGCLLLELAVFIREGPAGISRLQVLRKGLTSAGGWTMQSDLFHDGTSLKPQIKAWLEKASILGVFSHGYSQEGPPADVNQILLRMFNTDPRERPSAREVAMAWKDIEYFSISKVTRQLAGLISVSSHIDRLFSWAGKLISKEPSLAPGRKRVYWKCTCSRIFHDDFIEITPGAVNDMQKSLNDLYGPVSTTRRLPSIISNQQDAVPGTASAGQTSANFNQFELLGGSDIGLQGLPTKTEQTGESSKPLQDMPGNFNGRDFASQTADIIKTHKLWLIPCFESPVFGTRASHEDVSKLKAMFDFEMFTRFREVYFSQKSWVRRFFDLREVKTIRFVRFAYLSGGKADILSKDDIWPPPEESNLWVYVPCPPDVTPLVGQKLLLHLWRNPHHADSVVYRSWQRNASHWQYYSEWVRQLLTPKDLIIDLESHNIAVLHMFSSKYRRK